VPDSDPKYATYLAVAASAMNTPIATFHPEVYFTVNSTDHWTCSNLAVTNYR
jgi:hypothetical protein